MNRIVELDDGHVERSLYLFCIEVFDITKIAVVLLPMTNDCLAGDSEKSAETSNFGIALSANRSKKSLTNVMIVGGAGKGMPMNSGRSVGC